MAKRGLNAAIVLALALVVANNASCAKEGDRSRTAAADAAAERRRRRLRSDLQASWLCVYSVLMLPQGVDIQHKIGPSTMSR